MVLQLKRDQKIFFRHYDSADERRRGSLLGLKKGVSLVCTSTTVTPISGEKSLR